MHKHIIPYAEIHHRDGRRALAQCGAFRDADTIALLFLGFVKSVVRRDEHARERYGLLSGEDNADADGDRNLGLQHGGLADVAHQRLKFFFRPPALRLLCQNHELVTAEAADLIAALERAAQAVGDDADDLISRHMPAAVVDALEIVQIQNGECIGLQRRLFQELRVEMLECGLVQQPRHRIHGAHVDEAAMKALFAVK